LEYGNVQRNREKKKIPIEGVDRKTNVWSPRKQKEWQNFRLKRGLGGKT